MSPNAGGGESCRVSANEYSCAHGAQINFGDLTPHLTDVSLKFKRRKSSIDVVLLHVKRENLKIFTLIFFNKHPSMRNCKQKLKKVYN